ncbi:MAG: ABC transporter ATP-binding protein [Candidatus Binataceae bacterium]
MVSRGVRLMLHELAKSYGNMVALEPTNLAIEAGEFFSLLGPSGSGKSTLLGTIAGFVPPTRGRIEVDGVDIVGIPPYRRNIGMVFQNYALFPHMDVFENIAFPLRLRKLRITEIQTRVARALAMVQLPDFGSRSVGQLSGGQQQRVALARAAVYGPRVLLMDEPLGALDKNLRADMQSEIKAAHRELGATTVYVTHDQDEAAAMSDRIAIMNQGRIVQVGTSRDLYEHPRNAFVAGFLGDANLFAIADHAGGSGCPAIRLHNGALIHAPDDDGVASGEGDSVVCVRPDAIRLVPAGTRVAADLNHLSGHVVDTVFAAGVQSFRVEVGTVKPLLVRSKANGEWPTVTAGSPIMAVWPKNATRLIPKE